MKKTASCIVHMLPMNEMEMEMERLTADSQQFTHKPHVCLAFDLPPFAFWRIIKLSLMHSLGWSFCILQLAVRRNDVIDHVFLSCFKLFKCSRLTDAFIPGASQREAQSNQWTDQREKSKVVGVGWLSTTLCVSIVFTWLKSYFRNTKTVPGLFFPRTLFFNTWGTTVVPVLITVVLW